MSTERKKLLLHICCAPDASVVVERLRDEYDITGFFYNPNVHPQAEYGLRASETIKLAGKMAFPLAPAPYDPDYWFEQVRGMEQLPEKSHRCRICMQIRLEKTAQYAHEKNFDLFTTVLSVSPHKDAALINFIGQTLAKKHHISFLEANFKKKDGFKRSLELTKEYNLYRQNYCGCIFSKR